MFCAAAVLGGLILAGIGLNARPEWHFRLAADNVFARAQSVIVLLTLIAMMAALVYALATRRLPASAGRVKPAWRTYLLTAVLFAMVLWLLHSLRLTTRRPRPPASSTATKAPSQQNVHHQVGGDLYVWLTVFIVVLGVAGYVVVSRARRIAALRAEEAGAQRGPLDAAAAALARAGTDPRSRVIEAYDAMERALGSALRLGRKPQQTPEEWLAQVSTGHPVLAGSAAELTALFEQARFSRLPIGAADAARAAELVRGMQAALAPEVPAT